jgi:hypothetical protein
MAPDIGHIGNGAARLYGRVFGRFANATWFLTPPAL